MPRKKKDDIPILRVPENATDQQIYAQYRKEFTAADLQQYTDLDPKKWVPFDKVLAELEDIQRETTRKKRRKR
jgi:hypothetical protein